MPKIENNKVDDLEGVLESILYTSEKTHFTVARFCYSESEPSITVVGNIFSMNVGEKLRISGVWKKHARYGAQIEIERFEVILPTKKDAIEKYLGSGLIKGIGPSLAKSIVQYFGEKTFNILDSSPKKLTEIPGIGKKKAQIIENSWKIQRSRHEMMMFLTSYGIKGSRAAKIYKKYGGNLVSVIQKNPYRLTVDIDGVGFLTADRIAREVGVSEDDPERIKAATVYTIEEASSQGHCYLPKQELVEATSRLLSLDINLIESTLEKEIKEGHQFVSISTNNAESSLIYLRKMYFYETEVAKYLKKILKTSFSVKVSNPEKWVKKTETKIGIEFHYEQTQALIQSLTKKISVITGGPGVGKTTIVKALVALLRKKECRIALAAPTGRAAKRLSEASGEPASTIHRLLGYNPYDNDFMHNQENQLKIDWLIIDETSMMDISLSYYLLRAIPEAAAITFVGDYDQLPSVGAGNFLEDLIKSKVIPLTRLTYIYRQSIDSSIVQIAHEINTGYLPKIVNSDNSDIFFLPVNSAEEGASLITDLVCKRLPKKYNLDPFQDIQTLVPMYRGEVGADNLNAMLSKTLNPSGKSIASGKFREGDKVMQISNNYEKEVYNGDMGVIWRVNRIDRKFSIVFDKREIIYEFSELDQIALAYAISIHKSQGSEYRVVVIPVFTQHFIMLQRNLLYTAITRGKELVVIVGSWRALGIAVGSVNSKNRYTKLADWIKES